MSRVVNARKRLERAALDLQDDAPISQLLELSVAAREFRAAIQERDVRRGASK